MGRAVLQDAVETGNGLFGPLVRQQQAPEIDAGADVIGRLVEGGAETRFGRQFVAWRQQEAQVVVRIGVVRPQGQGLVIGGDGAGDRLGDVERQRSTGPAWCGMLQQRWPEGPRSRNPGSIANLM
jgi:hypothetical protein